MARLVDRNALIVGKATVHAVLQDWLQSMFLSSAPCLLSFEVNKEGDYTLLLDGPSTSKKEAPDAQ